MLLNNILQISTIILPIFFPRTQQQQAAWTSLNFPDPREDFVRCHLKAPGTICDPDGILRKEELLVLERSIENAEILSRNAIYQTQECQNSPTERNSGVQFFIVAVNKVADNDAAVGYEKFIEFVREVYTIYAMWDLNHQLDAKCDKTIFIAVSKNDGQLYTISGKDVQITSGILDDAFTRNKETFTSGQFATGLTEMITLLTKAYKEAHSVPADNSRLQQQLQSTTTRPDVKNTRTSLTVSRTTKSFTISSAASPTLRQRPDKPSVIKQPLNDNRNEKVVLTPKEQELWQELLTAIFKFFADAFAGISVIS
uniref:TPM domain-containing protein n=1 Tax=Plectus sambesii TaxID=2011161 RepID=A0A914UYP7_9BILA